MKQSDLLKIKEFYEKTILQQVIRPLEINPIYQLIETHEENPMGIAYFIKQRRISVFVQNKQWEVLDMLEDLFTEPEIDEVLNVDTVIPEDSAASPVIPDDTQSHSEDLGEELKAYSEELDEVAALEAEYQDADANRKRSITMRLKSLKK